MYKTVKQGENCLQYTILPQTEEILSNSGLKGKGRDYSPSVHMRKTKSHRTAKFTLAISVTIAVIFIISGIPMYVIIRAFFSDSTDQIFFYGKQLSKIDVAVTTPITSERGTTGSSHKRVLNEQLYNSAVDTSKSVKTEVSTVTGMTSRLETTIKTTRASSVDVILQTKKPWLMPALKRLLSTSTEVTQTQEVDSVVVDTVSYDKSLEPFLRQRESNTDLMLDRLHYSHWTEPEEVLMRPTPTLTALENRILQDKPHVVPEPTSMLQTTLADILFTHNEISTVSYKLDDSTETMRMEIGEKKFKDIKDGILDDDDYSDYKDPLVDEDDVQSGSDDVKMSQAKQTWLQNKWPFVDPSSYFQWTGYSAGDNLLLPAILAAALSALLVLGIVYYALRRRQRQARITQDIGKITSDLQADDNTNLLTAENMSEDD